MGFPTTDRNSFLDSQITGTLYVALYTVAPDDDGTGGTEVTGGSYARVSFSDWTTASAGAKSNNTAVEFPESTASWGTVVAATVMTLASGGVQKAVTDTFTNKAIGSGEIARFSAGELDFTFS